MTNEDKIKARIRGRLVAQTIHDMLSSDLEHEGVEYRQSFIDALKAKLGLTDEKLVLINQVDWSIKDLGGYLIAFGKHSGKTLDEIPLDYLDWLCRDMEERGNKDGVYPYVRAYLKHPDLDSRRRGLYS